jgi:ribosomal-protein-alanine N-acetyltransferase
MVLETKRLLLRQMIQDDLSALCRILQDEEVMYAYEHAFSDAEAADWLNRQLQRYKDDGFGLWAVILKESGELIGQCGLTMQEIPEGRVVEIGYLFRKDCWHKGYATEAAIGCKEYAFDTLGVSEVYSIIRDNNIASQNVARRNGMEVCGQFTKHYYGIDMPHLIFCVKNPHAQQ